GSPLPSEPDRMPRNGILPVLAARATAVVSISSMSGGASLRTGAAAGGGRSQPRTPELPGAQGAAPVYGSALTPRPPKTTFGAFGMQTSSPVGESGGTSVQSSSGAGRGSLARRASAKSAS